MLCLQSHEHYIMLAIFQTSVPPERVCNIVQRGVECDGYTSNAAPAPVQQPEYE